MTRKPVVPDYYIVLTGGSRPSDRGGGGGRGEGGRGNHFFTIADNLEPLLRCIHVNIDEEGQKANPF